MAAGLPGDDRPLSLWPRRHKGATVHMCKRLNRGVRALVLMATILAWRADLGAGELTLSCLPAAGNEVGFSVERSTGVAGAFAETGQTGPDATTYVDPNVAPGVTYCYRVRAFNDEFYSDYSNTACGTTALGLTVLKMGEGAGTVVSSPSGITCGTNCAAPFPSGTPVTLTGTPASGSTFSGWSGGGCSGTGTCVVTLTATTTIQAAFAPQSPTDPPTNPPSDPPTNSPPASATLTLVKSGSGTGAVSSSPAGIDCGASCSSEFPIGASVV